MIATLSRLLALLIPPLLYALASAGWSAWKRSGFQTLSMVPPPIFSFRSTNCSMLILPLLERLEPVLHADVVERQSGEAVADLLLGGAPHAGGPRTEDVHHVVREHAAHAAGVRLSVVVVLGRDARAAVVRHSQRGPVDRVEHDRVHVVGVTLDRRDRVRRPGDTRPPLRRVLRVKADEVVVDKLLARRPRVREAARRQDALVDAGVGVRHLLLRERAARAAGADRVADLAVLLDEPLLRHHHRLGLGDDVAVVPGVVQRRRHDREAARQRRVVLDVGRRARLVVDPAARAVGDQQLVVPPCLRPRAVERLRRVVQDRDLVLVAVLVARLDPDDVGDRLALVGGRRGDVGRRVVRVVVGERATGVLVAELVGRPAGCTARRLPSTGTPRAAPADRRTPGRRSGGW